MYINTRTYIFNNKAKFIDFYLYYKINYNFFDVTRNLCMLHNFTLHNFKVSGVMFNIDFLCSFLLYVESLPFSLPPPRPSSNSLHYFLYASHLHLLDVCCYYIFVHIFRIAFTLSEISLTVVLPKHFMRKCIYKCIM